MCVSSKTCINPITPPCTPMRASSGCGQDECVKAISTRSFCDGGAIITCSGVQRGCECLFILVTAYFARNAGDGATTAHAPVKPQSLATVSSLALWRISKYVTNCRRMRHGRKDKATIGHFKHRTHNSAIKSIKLCDARIVARPYRSLQNRFPLFPVHAWFK
jgi:hypothetical protein